MDNKDDRAKLAARQERFGKEAIEAAKEKGSERHRDRKKFQKGKGDR